jgi:hypothetical protein
MAGETARRPKTDDRARTDKNTPDESVIVGMEVILIDKSS